MSSNRYIIDFKCSEPFIYTHDFGYKKADYEFATIYIKGQSFMLHQIRKMIGMTLTILRGFQQKSDITRSFESIRVSWYNKFNFFILIYRWMFLVLQD